MKKISFRTWIVTGISLSLLLVTAVGLSSYLSLSGLKNDQKWIDHTENVIKHTIEINKVLTEAETSQRGYIISGRNDFLEEYKQKLPKIESLINELSILVADNPAQIKKVDSLKYFTLERIKIFNSFIELRDQASFKLNDQYANKLYQGKQKMEQVKSNIKDIIHLEENLLVKRQEISNSATERTVRVIILGTILIFIIVIVLFIFIQNAFSKQRKSQTELNESKKELEKLFAENKDKNWILTGSALLNEDMQGEHPISDMANIIITDICKYADVQVGAIYIVDSKEEKFVLEAGFALSNSTSKIKETIDSGWIIQVAKDRKPLQIEGKLRDGFEITSGLIKNAPIYSFIVPFYFNGKIKGVLELGFSQQISAKQKDFILNAASVIGVAINTSQSRELLQNLFEETQLQAEELEVQQEELRVTNEELMSKTQMLQSSEEELRVQQEELKEINVELEEKARLLEDKNRVIEEAREAIIVKMQQLEQSGKYKSEFLANMSHELRTPLNSILILARILKDNKSNNLSAEESKYANVIFKAGNDLLELINDILDLAKIESGKLDFTYESTAIEEISEDLKMLFSELANTKEIEYLVSIDEGLTSHIDVDKVRLEQILKNLLSNAFKFTPKNGKVNINFIPFDNDQIKIEVADSGIGIPLEKQKIIFEAFQQADGSTSREYGGTGLGLSICKELAHRMSGKITLESEAGKGSKFALIIPVHQSKEQTDLKEIDHLVAVVKDNFIAKAPEVNNPQQFENALVKEKPVLLVVEDDSVFNDFLKEYGVNKGFDVVQIYNGEDVLEAAIKHQPDAVLLDIMLPGIDGWKVLKQLKSELKTGHIPVHMMSAGDQRPQKAIQSGALSFMKKPIAIEALDQVFNSISSPELQNYQNILLVEDHQVQSDALAEMFRNKGVHVKQAYTGKEALEFLDIETFDCLILDLNLPDISGLDLLEHIKADEKYQSLPVVINTAMELDQDKLNRLLKYSDATVMKSNKSSDRLLDEVNLFLHQIKQDDLKKEIKKQTRHPEELKNKNILLVDDDMRNIFALSAVLDGFGFAVTIANDGEEALTKLQEMPKADLVLMDIMMPKMDGFEAMKEIRKHLKWKNLPIIALTAKAMKEDRDNCIAAGANDYITKPVDVDKLMGLIKVWLA